jgi:hypothetical protein
MLLDIQCALRSFIILWIGWRSVGTDVRLTAAWTGGDSGLRETLRRRRLEEGGLLIVLEDEDEDGSGRLTAAAATGQCSHPGGGGAWRWRWRWCWCWCAGAGMGAVAGNASGRFN